MVCVFECNGVVGSIYTGKSHIKLAVGNSGTESAVGTALPDTLPVVVGVEETGLFKAAVGAEETGPDGSAGAASATLGEAASPGEAVADADKFLRNEVVGWMSSLEAVGSSLPEALDAALAALGKTPEDMVQAFKVKVPWVPCVNFKAVPKYSKQMHLAHFDVVI